MHVCVCVCFLCVHINVMYVCVRAHDSIAGHCARFCWHFGGAYQKESGTWVRRLKLFSRVEAFRWEAARVFAFSAWISVLLCFPSVFIYTFLRASCQCAEMSEGVCVECWMCSVWALTCTSQHSPTLQSGSCCWTLEKSELKTENGCRSPAPPVSMFSLSLL